VFALVCLFVGLSVSIITDNELDGVHEISGQGSLGDKKQQV